MKRPMLWALAFMILGILVGYYMPIAVYVTLFSLLVIFTLIFHKKHIDKYFLAIFLLFYLFGFYQIGEKISIVNKELSILAENKVEVNGSGVVGEIYTSKSGNTRLSVKSDLITWTKGEYNKKMLKLCIWTDAKRIPKIGDEISFAGIIEEFSRAKIPGGYDEWLYYKINSYDYKIFAKKIKFESSTESIFNSAREDIKAVYNEVLPQRESSIISAIVIGDKEVDPEVRDIYVQSGIIHLLAISGLHVTMIGGYIFFFLKKILGFSKRICSGITIVILLVYLIFVGYPPSAVRAVVMVIVMLFGNIIHKYGDSLNNIGVAALILLIVQPLFLWDIGFQLSFVVVTSILLSQEKSLWNIKNSIFKKSLWISTVATVASYPLVAYHFYFISLVSIIVNIIVLPFVGLLLGMGFLVGTIGIFSIEIARFFAGTIYFILRFYENISLLSLKIPFSYPLVGSPTVLFVLFCYIGMLIFFLYTACTRGRNIAYSLVISVLLILTFGNRFIFRNNKVSFLDVGQGDSTIITTYDKRTFIIDGGGKFGTDLSENTGVKVILPYLYHEGISKIDGIFVTHMDFDHVMGIIELLEQIPIEGVYISEYDFEITPTYQLFLRTIKNNNIPLYTIKEGDKATLGDYMEIKCLYPSKNQVWNDADDNHGSLVLDISLMGTSFLLMGDAGIKDEEEILNNGLSLDTDILKLGHHGSKYSTSEKFLDEITPEFGIASAGKNNSYGHPHDETLDRLEDDNIEMLNTAHEKTITISVNNNGYKITTMRGLRINCKN